MKHYIVFATPQEKTNTKEHLRKGQISVAAVLYVGRIPVMVENGDIAVTIPACSAVVYRTK